MTSLVSWTSYRSGQVERPNSIYVVSDSRITWGTPQSYWDGGRKVFTCRIEAHVFGYCGDVVFPSLVLAQIVSAIDNGVMFRKGADAAEKSEVVYNSFKQSFERRQDAPNQDFFVLHAQREGEAETTAFSVSQISYDSQQKKWNNVAISIPSTTGIIAILGSGKLAVQKRIDRWINSDVGARSSAFFSGFCDALFEGDDEYSGGMPQIGALNRGSHAQMMGFATEQACYLNGLEVMPMETLGRIKWADRYFQNVDPLTRKPKDRSRRLVRPNGV